MIVLSVLFQNIGKFLCLKLFKSSLRDIRKQWHWKRFVYEFSGTIFLFLIAFIVNASIMTYYGKVYLANDSLTHGIEVSEPAESIGFQDGDKLVTINGEKIIKFIPRYFLVDLLLADNPYVDIERGITKIRLHISDEHKRMISDHRKNFIKAKYREELQLTYENYSISEITTNFHKNIKAAIEYATTLVIGPPTVQGYKKVLPVVILDVFNFTSFLRVFSFLSLILIIINLIPLPGLDSGNMIIALLEHKREKVFPAKKLFIIRLLGIAILIIWVLVFEFL